MKKLLLFILLLTTSFVVFAQKSPIKFGVKAGLTLSKFAQTDNGAFGKDPKTYTSFYIGGTVDIPLISMLSLQSGLTLIEKGNLQTYNISVVNTTIDDKINITYLELPLNFLANFAVGKNKLFVGAGPYYSLAIGGKHQYEGTMGGAKDVDEEDLVFGSGDDDDLKSNDFGVNFLVGFELSNKFNIHAGYGLGLSDISNSTQSGFKQNNRTISFGLGFKF